MWDFIIVGAGSAGATLAARLTEKGNRVLLLEAGADHRSKDLPEVLRSPNPFRAVVQPETWDDLLWMDLQGRRAKGQEASLYWRGKGTGGSSVINGQLAIRPDLADFDEWAENGCTGWSAKDVLPYFVKLETDQEFGLREGHGNSGPIPIHHPQKNEWGLIDAAFADAVIDAGFEFAEDVNAPSASGLSPYPVNSKNGARVTVNDAYLEPLRESKLLKIQCNSIVDRVLFDGFKAIGVLLVNGKVEHGKEIILAAGAVHSPTILLRSGIGEKDDLNRIGVPELINLPVGLGLQDHARIDAPIRVKTAPENLDARHTSCILRYSSGDPDGFPSDTVIVSLNQAVLAMEDASKDIYEGAFVAWLNRVHSRGRIFLNSNDPHEQPLVEINMLTDKRDRKILRKAVKQLAKLVRSDHVTQIVREPVEVSARELLNAVDANDDAILDEFLLREVGDTQHATSTCAMGRRSVGVVDSNCRVFGSSGLRVIDASIFPSVPSANTHIVTVMAAELMADRITEKS